MKSPMRYHKIPSKIWTDPAFRSWSAAGRAVALYLITCPHRNTEGLFRMPVPLAAYDLGISEGGTAAALGELEEAGFIARDHSADLVWIVDAIRWDPPVGPNQVKGAVRVLAELPDTPLRERYLAVATEACPDLAEALTADLGWSTESPSEAPSNPLPNPSEAPSNPLPNPSEAPSNPHSHSHPHSHPLPTTTTGDTQDARGPDPGGGGGSPSPSAEEPNAGQLADELLLRLGYVGDAAEAGADLIGYVDRALSRGWPALDLQDLATEIGAMPPDEIETTPMRVLLGAVRKRANSDPTVRTNDGRTIRRPDPNRVDEILANIERVRAGEVD